jgi:hypothetical protein
MEQTVLLPFLMLTNLANLIFVVFRGTGKASCPECGTQFSKRANLELHMFMHRGQSARPK